MTRFFAAFLALAALASMAPVADAHGGRHHGYNKRFGYLPLGYHRHGPPSGYKFGFATYRGDPFARDDYYDGGSCYYTHHRDYCLRFRKPFDPFDD